MEGHAMTGKRYQVMPPLAEPEYDALKASIAAGYDPARPVVVDENGAILDGHHRQQACAELGITPPTITLPGLTEDQKHDYAMRANLAQRHLTQLQKRELIRAELGRDPSRSDREIGRLVGADHKTVASVRRGGEIPHARRDEEGHEQLARNAAEMLELHDEIEADRALARECAEHWRETWTRIMESLRLCAEAWNPVIAEHTGYATCWDWLQKGDVAEDWRFVAENVSELQNLSPWMAEWMGVDSAPITPAIAEAELMLRGAA
jgi:ParB-like chromosome segregation protein Spo0J